MKKEKMKIAKKGKGEGRGKERLKKAVIGILLAVIMLGSAFSMMTHLTTGSDVTRTTVRNSYVVNPDNVTISIDGNTSSVLIGQNVQFMYGGNKTGTVTVTGVEGTPAEGHVVTSDSTGWLDTSVMVEGLYNATYENQWELLAVDSPEMALWFKVGETGVSSITQGTPLGIGFTSNLDVNDCVDLKVVTPEGYVLSQNPADPDQKFDDINVSKLLEYGSENKSKRVNTSGWDIGTYTFWVRSEEENARGLDVPTCARTLTVCKADITIEAEKTSIVELEKVRLTVAGVPNHNITISSSDPAHTIFPAGYEGNPPYDTSGFNDTIDEDGQRRYVVYFNDTGTYTITVTDVTAGLDDDIAITVSEKAVTFSMPSTCIIGRNLTIYGKANTGETIDIAIDDYVMPELNDIITNEFGSFEEGIETDWMAPGSYGIRGFIDRAAGPGDVSGEEDDGATAILMIEEGLTVNLSTDIVPLGDNCDIYGTSSTNYVEIVTITPKGGNGTGRDGLYGVTIDTVPTSNYNFYKRIKVDSGADTGNYTILVLSPGRDSVYGNSPYKYIDNILDLDGAGPEPGVIDVSNKTQHEIVSIVKDVTIDQAGSDDLLWERHLTVCQPKIYVDDDFEDDPANHRWNTIQEGINDANDRATIIVRDGTYTENVDVNKRLTIKSENGSASTIVQAANPDDHIFEVTADCVNISGFTVRRATKSMNAGIYLRFAEHCTISNNIASNNNYGIRLVVSSSNNISNNTISNNDYGIEVSFSNNNTISNNTFLNNGLFVWYSYHNYVGNNTVNSKPLVYLENISDFAIPDAGQIILVNCNNISAKNLNLSNTDVGIGLWGTNNSKMSNNIISNNVHIGFRLWYSSNNTLLNNTISNSSEGIRLDDSSSNTISNNTLSNNGYYGIKLFSSNKNTILNNIISSNRGICLGSSDDNIIYLNNFIAKTYNIFSYDSSNIWNSTSKITYVYNETTYENYTGNYWSDYKGNDANGDGIGDAPYSIDSDKDNYPLMERFENYFAPTENIFDTGESENPYPSIFGTHNGTITPYHDINVSKIYTYPCPGTGGHTEYVAFSNAITGEEIVNGSWNGYQGAGDYHYIEFDSPFILQASVTYNYTIRTGSYPQIIHAKSKDVTGGVINCTEFTDANGKKYDNWIPAIRLDE